MTSEKTYYRYEVYYSATVNGEDILDRTIISSDQRQMSDESVRQSSVDSVVMDFDMTIDPDDVHLNSVLIRCDRYGGIRRVNGDDTL